MSDNTNFPNDNGFDDWDFGNPSQSEPVAQSTGNDMWDDVPSSTQQNPQPDIWGGQQTQQSTSSTWEDFDWDSPASTSNNQPNSTTTNSGQSMQNDQNNTNQQGVADLGWGETTQTGSQFLNDSQGWGGEVANGTYMQDSTPQFDNGMDSDSPYINQPKEVKLSKKSVGLIIALVFIVVALILFFFDNVKITKNPTTPQSQTQNSQTQQNQNNQGGQGNQQGGQDSQQEYKNNQNSEQQKPSDTQNSSESEKESESGKPSSSDMNSVTLVEIPYTTNMVYSRDVYDANGKVIAKDKFVQGNQVIYCVELQIVIGNSNQTLRYYCNYSSYNAVNVGDMVVITYQQVNDTFISINSIAK